MTEIYSSSDFGSGFSNESSDPVAAGFKEYNICGEGASCIVYRMNLDGLRVAVKRLKSEYLSSPQYIASYRKEYGTGLRLKHDALPVYRSLHNDMRETYIVMDYVDGVSAEDFIKTTEGKEYFRSTDNVRKFLRRLLDVVCYLHRSGVIHCDLKPANIMLRHSDRGVMLLDLDKSYCDIMDDTHGGTASVSAPLKSGEKPTAYKDFAAIGNIIDEIAGNVPEFPVRAFQRFRNECLDKNTDGDRLTDALDHKSDRRFLKAAAMATILISIPVAILWNRNAQDSTEDYRRSAPVESNDTIAVMPQLTPQPEAEATADPTSIKHLPPASSTSAYPAKQQEIVIDIDTPMAEFISKLETADSALKSGITRKQLSDLLSDLIATHSAAYLGIIKDAKQRYPDIPGIDVELAVARALERSRAGRLYTSFNDALSDSLRKWDQPSGSDDDLQ